MLHFIKFILTLIIYFLIFILFYVIIPYPSQYFMFEVIKMEENWYSIPSVIASYVIYGVLYYSIIFIISLISIIWDETK